MWNIFPSKFLADGQPVKKEILSTQPKLRGYEWDSVA